MPTTLARALPSLTDIVTFVALVVDLSRKRRLGLGPGEGGSGGAGDASPASLPASGPASAAAAMPALSLRADYDVYCVARDASCAALQRFLTAMTFAKLPKHRDGTVAVLSLAQYLRLKVILLHVVGRLLAYDSVGDRALREHDVENFVFEAIPGVPELAALQENFYPFYVFTAVRKFFFLLDPNHTGKISVRAFAASRAFAEWMRLLPAGHTDLGPVSGCVFSRLRERASVRDRAGGPGATSGNGGEGGGPPHMPLAISIPAVASELDLEPDPEPEAAAAIAAGSPLLDAADDVGDSKGSVGGGSPVGGGSADSCTLQAEEIVSACWQGGLENRSGGGAENDAGRELTAARASSPDAPASGLNHSPPSQPPLMANFAQAQSGGSATVTPAPASVRPSNWFSAPNALRVYSQYLQLDADQNGMLSCDELAAYRGGVLTPACVHRIFEECHTYGGEIDFKVYLDIVLALENRTSKAAQRFLFKLLDMHHVGRIGLSEVQFFFADVAARLAAQGHEHIDVANICDEVFDMIRPKRPHFFTLADLLNCKMGGTACGILLDTAAFVAYDRREELRVAGLDDSQIVPADADWLSHH